MYNYLYVRLLRHKYFLITLIKTKSFVIFIREPSWHSYEASACNLGVNGWVHFWQLGTARCWVPPHNAAPFLNNSSKS